MIYALRKLIAFVFLGGMFWFIYQDLDNLGKPWFMHALGMIAISFIFFWLLIPMVVVWFRIRNRRAQNRERYRKWLDEGGVANLEPRHAFDASRVAKAPHLVTMPDERMFFHEKGTLYVCGTMDHDAFARTDRPIGRPSDVAFPGFRRTCHVCQRTHCYFTNRRIVFKGKDLESGIPFANLKKISVEPGGIVFEAKCGGDGVSPEGSTSIIRFAFTFQNPLIAMDVLHYAKNGNETGNVA